MSMIVTPQAPRSGCRPWGDSTGEVAAIFAGLSCGLGLSWLRPGRSGPEMVNYRTHGPPAQSLCSGLHSAPPEARWSNLGMALG